MPIPEEVWEAMAELDGGEAYHLIEWQRWANPTMYYVGLSDVGREGVDPTPVWTHDPERAMCFSTHGVASRCAREQRLTTVDYRITEHVLMEEERQGDAPQAGGSEVDQGGVPAVQAPQDGGNALHFRRVAQLVEEDGCDCREVGSQPRRLELTITGCTGCPFCIHVPEDMEVDTEGHYDAGWYCGHPRNRTTTDQHMIVSEQNILDSPAHVSTLKGWLQHHERSTFSHKCPLPKPRTAPRPIGGRMLDVG